MKKVPIPEKMQKFYGTGTMLHPDEEMVEALIKEIPVGKVATIDSLCQRLARDNDTDVTCPMRTSHLVKAATENALGARDVPYWRVIRKNHLLINSSLTMVCAANLEREGLRIGKNSKGEFKVQNAEDLLFTFP